MRTESMLLIITQLPFSAKKFGDRSPPPKKLEFRERQYLYSHEIKSIIRAAKKVGRHGVRDSTIILLMFRHGLRTAELVALKWSQIDLVGGYIFVQRVKHGHDSTHPLRNEELRALRQMSERLPRYKLCFCIGTICSSFNSFNSPYCS